MPDFLELALVRTHLKFDGGCVADEYLEFLIASAKSLIMSYCGGGVDLTNAGVKSAGLLIVSHLHSLDPQSATDVNARHLPVSIRALLDMHKTRFEF